MDATYLNAIPRDVIEHVLAPHLEHYLDEQLKSMINKSLVPITPEVARIRQDWTDDQRQEAKSEMEAIEMLKSINYTTLLWRRQCHDVPSITDGAAAHLRRWGWKVRRIRYCETCVNGAEGCDYTDIGDENVSVHHIFHIYGPHRSETICISWN